MITKNLKILAVVGTIAASVLIVARDTDKDSTSFMTNKEPLKIAVYDPDEVMGKSKELKSELEKLEKKYEKTANELKSEEQQLINALNEYNKRMEALKESSLTKDNAYETAQEDLLRKRRDFEGKAKNFEQDYMRDRQNLLMRFAKKLDEAIKAYQAEYDFDLVMPEGPGIAASKRAKGTNGIVAYINKKFDEKVQRAAKKTDTVKTA